MWKRFLILLAYDTVTAVILEWARRQGKPWALDLEIFLREIKTKI